MVCQPLAIDQREEQTHKNAYCLADVNIVNVPETPVAVLQHRGNPALVAETIQKFIAWRRAAGLSAASSATYTVFHSDSDITPPDEFRLDICAATDRKIELNDQGVEAGVLPAGRCAVLRAIGAEMSSRRLNPCIATGCRQAVRPFGIFPSTVSG